MRRWCLLVALSVSAACACRSSAPDGATVRRSRAGTISVADFGARGDGVTDDREAIQAAIRASGGRREVYLPPGTYSISDAPGGHRGLELTAGVHLRGAGADKTVLLQATGAGRSVRLLHASGDGILIEDLALDGQRDAQTPDEQRHGLFATRTDHLVVRRVTARRFTGDGFYLHHGATDSRFTAVVATDNGRNGITLGGRVDRTAILDSRFASNRAQQVDSEPGGTAEVTRTTIAGCDIDVAGASNDYALTVSGTPRAHGSGWTILGNRIHGGIFVVWAEHVVIAGNTGINPTTKASVTVYRSSADVAVLGNRFVMTQTGTRSLAGVLIQGTGTGSAPERVVVAGNDIAVGDPQSFGVRAEGAISVAVLGNRLVGAGRAGPGYAGIYVRATNQAEDFRSAIVRGNSVRNFGARGVSLAGNGSARLLSVEITDNTFDDDSASPAMTAGISLDDGTGAARRISVAGNRCLHGVTQPVINPPRDPQVLVGAPEAPAAPAPR